jgi:hypothetical protein
VALPCRFSNRTGRRLGVVNFSSYFGTSASPLGDVLDVRQPPSPRPKIAVAMLYIYSIATVPLLGRSTYSYGLSHNSQIYKGLWLMADSKQRARHLAVPRAIYILHEAHN